MNDNVARVVRKLTSTFCAGALALAASHVVALSANGQQPEPKSRAHTVSPPPVDSEPTLAAPPKMKSLVPTIRLLNARLETLEGVSRDGKRSSFQLLKFDLHNDDARAIRVVAFGWGSHTSGEGEDKPDSEILVGGNSVLEMEMPAGNFEPGEVMELRAVIYADGTFGGSEFAARDARRDPADAQRAQAPTANGCPAGATWRGGRCRVAIPILIDTKGDGIDLSDSASGVLFDLGGDGIPDRTAWTRAGTDDGWLCVDVNGNGTIDDGAELLSNFAEQEPSRAPNGFLALARYDAAERGGDADGAITAADVAYGTLRVWIDADHDGVSQAKELKSLASLGVASISLTHPERQSFDAYGNCMLSSAVVLDAKGAQSGRMARDVVLATQ